MHAPRKFWFVLIGAILALAVIACSCSSIPLFSPTATPTSTPTRTPTRTPTIPVNPMPELEGYWLDTETNDVHVIEWQDGQYVVTAVNDDEYGEFAVTSQYWDGYSLTWTYKVSYNDTSVTFVTQSVSGDNLYTTWSNSGGNSGTETLVRVDSPTMATTSGGGEAIPGLAGNWLDPDTTGTITSIVWENGEYVITQIMNPDRGVNELTWYTWENGSLSWEYCPESIYCITSQLTDVSGDSMTAEWWWSDGGNGGTTTYQRMP